MPTPRASRLLRPFTAVLTVLLLCACGTEGPTAREDPTSSESPETPTGPTTDCTYPEDGSGEVTPPPEEAAASGQVAATIATSVGEIPATLDAEAAPCAVNSFTSLASQGYFDGTACHRLTTGGIFVLQCGDPTATGAGGPGYSFADELTGEETYPAGTIAMANAGPDTNGSQFFLVYEDTELPPAYVVLGTMADAGTDVVRAVAQDGVSGGAADGPPATEVTIDSVTVD